MICPAAVHGQRLLKAVNLTVNVPESANTWLGFCAFEVPPSPKSHFHSSTGNGVRSVNRTVSTAQISGIEMLKFVDGGVPTFTPSTSVIVWVQPPTVVM